MGIGTVAAFLALAAALTKSIREFAKGWLVKYVDWDDASRAEGSCWGNNITDVFMKYFKDGEWRSMFVVGTENYNPTGVHIRASKLKLIIQDFETGDGRVGTVQELLRDTGKIYERRGLDPSVTLLADGEDDPYVFYKVQVAIVPCSEGETVDTAIFATNYQARMTSRNAMFLANGQTTGLSLDKPNFRGQARYCLSEYNKEKDEWREFATTTDVSKRTIAQCGTETKEEALQAIAEGKTAEVPIGPEDGKKSSSIMSLQVPIKQDKLRQPRPERTREPASPAPKKQKPSRPPSPVSGYSDKSDASVATVKVEATVTLPAWGSPEFGPIGTGGSAVAVALDSAVLKPCLSHPVMAACAPAAMEEEKEVKAEPASEALDDEESELVALSPDDHSVGFRSLDGDDEEPKFCSCSSADDSEPSLGGLGSGPTTEKGGAVYRGLGAAAEAPAPAAGASRMEMGGVADALPELKKTKCKMGRFFKGPHLGKLAPLEGVNLERDKDGGIPTAVQTIIVTCPAGEEPTEDDVKELIKLAHSYLQCAANCEGSKANSLFSEFSKQLGQVTESITPQAVQGIIETVKAVGGSLPAGVF